MLGFFGTIVCMNDELLKVLELRVNEVLYYFWDPLDVNETPEAREEYDIYVPPLVGMLVAKKSQDAIAEALAEIEIDDLGLVPGDPQDCKDVAEKLCDWYAFLTNAEY